MFVCLCGCVCDRVKEDSQRHRVRVALSISTNVFNSRIHMKTKSYIKTEISMTIIMLINLSVYKCCCTYVGQNNLFEYKISFQLTQSLF